MIIYWNRLILFIVGVVSGSLAISAVIAPVVQHVLGFPHGEGIYNFLSPICHQYPTRSLWVLERPLGLCARCLSGYLGVFSAVLFWQSSIAFKKRVLIGIPILAVSIIEPLFQLLTSYQSTNIIRFVLGVLGGIALCLLLLPVIPVSPKGAAR
jgi:uncharacterized membrane protein